ncbi:MAG: preprotein translocase subunit SecA [Sedimentisphaerales bacterium]|jgi:preprotein translocase subunit SecA|nr:preprotein translocase subunit SecA [Sedimentisphaerales bacterium]NLT77523.1 preprotein translocase subunit SecA [Planctomycetota bacterium]
MAFDRVSKVLLKIFGSRNERLIKSYTGMVERANAFEDRVRQLDDAALKGKTTEFKAALAAGRDPEDILAEAFAVVRETARRTVEMRHFDVQLIGGNVLFEGKIAEMATGEGKTLVATLAAYMVHLTGRRVHLVTVNDYLAKRDAEWMAPVYNALGMTVGAIQADMDTAGQERKDTYLCDVTYGTNNEFGFDYLRDNMKTMLEQMVQGPLDYAIVDEVDSILIDEARTPLIISGPAFDDVTRYKKADQIARQLLSLQGGYTRIKAQIDAAERRIANAQGELSEAKKDKDNKRIEKAQQAIEKAQEEIAAAQARLTEATQYYEVEFDRKQVRMTDEGEKAAQDIAGMGSFYTGTNIDWPHLLQQSLRAHVVFEKEKDYVVMDGKVVIVDEFTGRLMQGRQWSDGLHQAVEAKEGVTVKEESQTLATITLQNFFKLYANIAGMTGTAATEADEFMKIYKLDVVVIPTNKPCVRDDRQDVIYKSMAEKFSAIVEEIHETSAAGRPVLVGTISIEKSELLSTALTKRHGLDHEVLNAKQHAREAQIVLKAGHQHKAHDGTMRGNVTIATNMAGRGTDIKLGPGVAQIGGLHILGTERHEARRIDNQLRGRAGRQGDAGSSQFFLSFDDDLMRVFAPEWTVKALSWIGWEEGQPIYHGRISKGIEKAQKKVEERNFEIRKSLLEYDEVMDHQRKIFYSRRRQVLEGRNLKAMIEEMIDHTITGHCESILDKEYPFRCMLEWARTNFDVELKISDVAQAEPQDVEALIKNRAKDAARNNISLSLGEYLEDYSDPSTWDVAGLTKWAMSAFKVNLSASKVKNLSPEEIEEQLVAAAAEQVDKRDCLPLAEFLRDDFALRRLAEWARAKFDLKLDVARLKELNAKQARDLMLGETAEKYHRREIEYPVEFAMSMAYGSQGANVYGFESLAQWANKKYNADLSAEWLQNAKPREVQERLLHLSESYNDGKLDEELAEKIARLNVEELVRWANERFEASLSPEDLGQVEDPTERLKVVGAGFLRRELADLERYVLLQVYDSTWKDHLYAMDHLKDSIWTRSFAEKDPKVEYKREGYRMFNEMLESIEDRVTDIIFRVHLEAGTRARSVWNVSQTTHDEVGQFAMAERQRAAAQAPQGEQKVKQIRLEQPKVGRNDPCPCGSGKKYKKCHGKDA